MGVLQWVVTSSSKMKMSYQRCRHLEASQTRGEALESPALRAIANVSGLVKILSSDSDRSSLVAKTITRCTLCDQSIKMLAVLDLFQEQIWHHQASITSWKKRNLLIKTRSNSKIALCKIEGRWNKGGGEKWPRLVALRVSMMQKCHTIRLSSIPELHLLPRLTQIWAKSLSR